MCLTTQARVHCAREFVAQQWIIVLGERTSVPAIGSPRAPDGAALTTGSGIRRRSRLVETCFESSFAVDVKSDWSWVWHAPVIGRQAQAAGCEQRSDSDRALVGQAQGKERTARQVKLERFAIVVIKLWREDRPRAPAALGTRLDGDLNGELSQAHARVGPPFQRRRSRVAIHAASMARRL